MLDEDLQFEISNFTNLLISSIPEFKELQTALSVLYNDSDSNKLFGEVNERKETITLMKSKGLPISVDQEKELSLLMDRMRSNVTIMHFLKCKNLARKKAIEIGNILEQRVGIDFASGKVCK